MCLLSRVVLTARRQQAVLAANEAQSLASLMDTSEAVPGDKPDTRPPSGWSALLTQIGVLLLNKLHLSIGNVHIRFVVRVCM